MGELLGLRHFLWTRLVVLVGRARLARALPVLRPDARLSHDGMEEGRGIPSSPTLGLGHKWRRAIGRRVEESTLNSSGVQFRHPFCHRSAHMLDLFAAERVASAGPPAGPDAAFSSDAPSVNN